MNAHESALRNFQRFLSARQAALRHDVDIRRLVLGLRTNMINIGYSAASLESGFGQNLTTLFHEAAPQEAFDNFATRNRAVTGVVSATREHSHHAAIRLFAAGETTGATLFFEQAWVSSAASWSHAFKTHDPAYACLGFVFDDVAHYYMAEYPNRLIAKLNSAETVSEAERVRARALMARLRAERVSKYNAQPIVEPPVSPDFARRVLVCDQTYADASTTYGLADEAVFQDMLASAIRDHPDAEIIVKTHPDTVWAGKKRRGYYEDVRSYGPLRILSEPINPYSLFDVVDHVYVASSQMGFEALIAGKKVTCFGAPFYAGWGITDDRQPIPHRRRTRDLEELFHYFYNWYSIYTVPGKDTPATLDDAIDYVLEHRPHPPPRPTPARTKGDQPDVSVVIPIHGVEPFLEQCLTSVLAQSLADIEVLAVNDCSPDRAQDIIDRLAAADPRLRSIRLTQNVKQGFARNHALKLARGRYVWFLDGDDYMSDPTTLERLVAEADAADVDLVSAARLSEREAAGLAPQSPHTVTVQESFAADPSVAKIWHVWQFLYRRAFLETHGVAFVTSQWEERPFVVKALLNARGIAVTDAPGNTYRVRPGSTVRRDRTLVDVEQIIANIVTVVTDAKAAGLPREAETLLVTQSLGVLFVGAWPATLRRLLAKPAMEGQFRRLSAAFQDLPYRFEDLDRTYLRQFAGDSWPAPRLAFAALKSGRFRLFRAAFDQEPFSQETAHAAWLDDDRELAQALSAYARKRELPFRPALDARRIAETRLILHLGASSAGGAEIQHFCERNRAELFRRGVWFPEFGLVSQPGRPSRPAGHAGFQRAAVRDDPALRNRLAAGLAGSARHIHTVVLSSEVLFLARRQTALARLFRDWRLEALLYLRRQDHWANTRYADIVSGGGAERVHADIAEWLRDPQVKQHLSYDLLAHRWRAALGPERLTIRPYERAQLKDGDVIADFCAQIGVDDLDGLERPDPDDVAPKRLAARHLTLMREFNQLPFRGNRAYVAFVDDVTAALAADADAGPELLSPDQRREILASYAESNAWIARECLGRADGRLFLDDEVAGVAPDAATPTPDEIALFFEAYRRRAGSVAEGPAVSRAEAATPPQSAPLSHLFRRSPRQLDEEMIRLCTIRSHWPLSKKLRVLVKNVLMGRPVIIERATG